MIEIAINWLIPTVLTGLYGYILKELKKISKENHATKNGVVLILRSQIVGECEKCIQQGCISDATRSCLEELFEDYESLGGNHGVGALVNQTFALPPIKKEE